MSTDTMPIIKLCVPKGSLEEATINLFERAGWKIRKHTRNYFPDINDPQITASLCRVQEIGEYIEAGVLDVGITGLDWLTERNHEDKVVRISDLMYSKTSNRPCRWVLAVAVVFTVFALRATSPASCTALTGDAVMSSSALLRRPARSPITQLAQVLALAVPVAATVSR